MANAFMRALAGNIDPEVLETLLAGENDITQAGLTISGPEETRRKRGSGSSDKVGPNLTPGEFWRMITRGSDTATGSGSRRRVPGSTPDDPELVPFDQDQDMGRFAQGGGTGGIPMENIEIVDEELGNDPATQDAVIRIANGDEEMGMAAPRTIDDIPTPAEQADDPTNFVQRFMADKLGMDGDGRDQLGNILMHAGMGLASAHPAEALAGLTKGGVAGFEQDRQMGIEEEARAFKRQMQEADLRMKQEALELRRAQYTQEQADKGRNRMIDNLKLAQSNYAFDYDPETGELVYDPNAEPPPPGLGDRYDIFTGGTEDTLILMDLLADPKDGGLPLNDPQRPMLQKLLDKKLGNDDLLGGV